MELQIRKKNNGVWEHIVVNGAQENCIYDPRIYVYVANNVLTLDYGANTNLQNFQVTDVKFFDDTLGGAETSFTSFDQLTQTLGGGNYPYLKPASETNEAIISEGNSSTTNLDASNGYTFTGTPEINKSEALLLVLFTDQDSTVQIQFSQNGVDFDSTITKQASAGSNEFTTAVKGIRYVRVIVSTDSLTTTVFRLQTEYGTYRQGNLPLNATVSQDSDAIIVRSISEEISLAEGKFAGYSLVSKLGRNSDIDTGTVPQDITDSGSLYTGFPVNDIETLALVSQQASDTGTVFVIGLDADWNPQTETVQMDGTNVVNTVNTYRRVHSAFYNDNTEEGFNAGNITITHSTTTSNLFITILAGRSQSNACVYTIPAGFTGYITKISANLRRSNSGSADGTLWVRTLGNSPRLRQPFSIDSDSGFERKIQRFALGQMTDVTARVTAVTNNNTGIVFQMEIRLVKNS